MLLNAPVPRKGLYPKELAYRYGRTDRPYAKKTASIASILNNFVNYFSFSVTGKDEFKKLMEKIPDYKIQPEKVIFFPVWLYMPLYMIFQYDFDPD